MDRFPEWVRSGEEKGWIRRYELELIHFIDREYGELESESLTAILVLSLFVHHGHTCLPLDVPVSGWFANIGIEPETAGIVDRVRQDEIIKHPAIGYAEDKTPFLIKDGYLYTRSVYLKEIKVAQRVKELSSGRIKEGDHLNVTERIPGIYESENGDQPDWQKVAILLATRNRLMVISGGPGTGKTTTAAGIIQILNGISEKPLRIALAAPTGKAAARMNESLKSQFQECKEGMRQGIRSEISPGPAKTLHRLLWNLDQNGMLPAPYSKHLPYDLIIVDEASMIDLGMMEKLLRYTDHHTRLILLGDKDQLNSVEAGTVLGDICQKKSNTFSKKTVRFLEQSGVKEKIPVENLSDLQDSVIYLTKTFRFGPDSGIFTLAEAVKNQQPVRALKVIDDKEVTDISSRPFQVNRKALNGLSIIAANKMNRVKQLRGNDMLAFWQREIWLTVLRRGPAGSDRLNRFIEESLVNRRVVEPHNGWYHGRPVMVTRNDYSLGIFNGDFGVCEQTDNQKYRILFTSSGDEPKSIPASRLKEFESGFFLTVHKSQGSEFDTVNLLMPIQDTPLLTRELIYTAITRAKKRFVIWGDHKLLKNGIDRKTERFTGLGKRIQ